MIYSPKVVATARGGLVTFNRGRPPAKLAAAPVLPPARAAALSLLQDDDVRLQELGDIVASDPGLTVILLRAANSAQSATRRRITHARDAMIRVGLAQTKRLVAAAVVDGAFDDLAECGIDLDAFWSYSLAAAVAAEQAAESNRLRPVAFSAGLLHDLGRLALAASAPDIYPSISRQAHSEGVILAAERLLFGENHAAIGARLLASWGLPDDLVSTVARHHGAPVLATDSALMRARQLVTTIGYTDGLPRDFAVAKGAPVEASVASALQERVEWYRSALRGSDESRATEPSRGASGDGSASRETFQSR